MKKSPNTYIISQLFTLNNLGYNFPYEKFLLPNCYNSNKHNSTLTEKKFFQSKQTTKTKNIIMDLSKLNINTFDGSNWGRWSAQVQSAVCILNCWDVTKGEVVDPTVTPLTYALLAKPSTCVTAKELATWNKKNSTALGVIQGKMSSAIWPESMNHATVATLWTALENKYAKAGRATIHLQVVSLYKIHMTNSSPLLPQIQTFQENYMQILVNRHSKLSEDITTLIFCSSLPSSYQDLASQYLLSVENIDKYSLQKINARIIEEES